MKKKCAGCDKEVILMGDIYGDAKVIDHLKKNKDKKRKCGWATKKVRGGIRAVCQMGPCPKGKECRYWDDLEGKKRSVFCGCVRKPTKKKVASPRKRKR